MREDNQLSLDQIKRIMAAALDVPEEVMMGGCLGGSYCSNGPFLMRRGAQVTAALQQLGCDPEAVAVRIRGLAKIEGFVITPEGFGPRCVAAGLLPLGVHLVLQESS